MIGPEIEAQIQRLFHAERWRIGTIASPRPGARALAAAGEAVGRVVREPLRTLGRGIGWVALAGCGTAVAFGTGALWDRHRAVWAVALLTMIQQTSLLWRVHCRMRWYAGLSRDEA